MSTRLLACFALVLTTGCASTESNGKNADAVAAKVSVSSVQMIQDCPAQDDPMPGDSGKSASATAAPAAMKPPALDQERAAPGEAMVGDSMEPFHQPCTQSTMQLAIKSEGATSASFAIAAVRIFADDKQVATIDARAPSAWVDSGYRPWDERLDAHAEIKASYKLSVPDWYEVEKKLGGNSSIGKMFVLEVDVMVDGRRQTIRSSAFPREEPHVVVT